MSQRMPAQPDDGDSIEIDPRPLTELVGRAMALVAVARRGMLEVERERDPYERETDRFDLFSWARTELGDFLHVDELRVLRTPMDELSDDDFVACQGALIGASTIGWALTVVNTASLPAPADGSAERITLEWAPGPWQGLKPAVASARVREEGDLANERERWELWFWRATEAEDASDELREVVAEVRRSGQLHIIAGDFAIDGGLPFGELSADTRDEIAHEAEQRLRALNWVCGFGDSWNDVPLYPD